MTKKKWWEIDLSQGDRSIEEIKVEFEENGSINLTETEVKRFDRYNRKEQKRLMSIPMNEASQSAITERKAIMFVVSGMFILLGFNVFGMGQSTSGFFLTSFLDIFNILEVLLIYQPIKSTESLKRARVANGLLVSLLYCSQVATTA